MNESNDRNDMGGMNRRGFLKNTALGVGALSAGLVGGTSLLTGQTTPSVAETQPIKIKEYRKLGRTGFKVSDISSGFVKDPVVLERLLDAGINYIDSAESYNNESVIGDVVKKRDRKSLFITTKLVFDKKDLSKESFITRTRKCLERLQTNYIDCMMIHSCETVEDLKCPGFHEAMKQLKSEGKVRFLGVSNHGTNWEKDSQETMEKVLLAAAEDGRFDVMLLAYNFIQEENSKKVLEVCGKKNIGTTLMKVNPIGSIPKLQTRIEELKKEGKAIDPYYTNMLARMEAKAKRAESYIKKYNLDNYDKLRQASIRFCLSNPDVHTVCCGFKNFDDLDRFITLSGTRLQNDEEMNLKAYKEGCGEFYCRHACNVCQSACPHHVPINSIMRFNHYYEAQGKEKYAMKHYARLSTGKADICATCSGQCEQACPHGVPVQGLLTIAHRTLSLV